MQTDSSTLLLGIGKATWSASKVDTNRLPQAPLDRSDCRFQLFQLTQSGHSLLTQTTPSLAAIVMHMIVGICVGNSWCSR